MNPTEALSAASSFTSAASSQSDKASEIELGDCLLVCCAWCRSLTKAAQMEPQNQSNRRRHGLNLALDLPSLPKLSLFVWNLDQLCVHHMAPVLALCTLAASSIPNQTSHSTTVSRRSAAAAWPNTSDSSAAAWASQSASALGDLTALSSSFQPQRIQTWRWGQSWDRVMDQGVQWQLRSSPSSGTWRNFLW